MATQKTESQNKEQEKQKAVATNNTQKWTQQIRASHDCKEKERECNKAEEFCTSCFFAVNAAAVGPLLGVTAKKQR